MYTFLEYLVEDVMTTPPVSIQAGATLEEAERLFEAHDFNGLPVLDESGRLVGFLTKLDLLKAFRFTEDHMFPPYAEIMKRRVDEVMSRDLVTVYPRTRLTRVLQKMLETRSKSFPVVEGDVLVGVVAREDLMRGLRRAVAGDRPWKRGESDRA